MTSGGTSNLDFARGVDVRTIFTLRNILEQCTEWNRELYVNFIDYEKAFDSIHRDCLGTF